MEQSGLTHRVFLVAAAAEGPASAGEDARPPVTDPRATDSGGEDGFAAEVIDLRDGSGS